MLGPKYHNFRRLNNKLLFFMQLTGYFEKNKYELSPSNTMAQNTVHFIAKDNKSTWHITYKNKPDGTYIEARPPINPGSMKPEWFKTVSAYTLFVLLFQGAIYGPNCKPLCLTDNTCTKENMKDILRTLIKLEYGITPKVYELDILTDLTLDFINQPNYKHMSKYAIWELPEYIR